MDNTLRVAEMVDLRLEFDQLRLPHFPVPEGDTAASWLRQECERGLLVRYGSNPSEPIRQRLDYELGVIERMGYAGYIEQVAHDLPTDSGVGIEKPIDDVHVRMVLRCWAVGRREVASS